VSRHRRSSGEYLATLERRCDHLSRRLAEAEAQDVVLTYDREELRALRWAMKLARRYVALQATSRKPSGW
jgi:hypothetical protein